eukprot:339571-Prorocentrum_minimum.AAC.1
MSGLVVALMVLAVTTCVEAEPHVIRLAAAPNGRLEFERGVQHAVDDSLKQVLRDHERKMLEGEETTGVQ